MEQHYYTYYEAYDSQGNSVWHGNSSFYTTTESATGTDVDNHAAFMLDFVKKQNASASYIMFKMVVKL